MQTANKRSLGWALVVVAMVLAALFFGVKYPLPEQPENVAGAGRSYVIGNSVQALAELRSDGTLDVAGVPTFGANPVFEGATANAYETTLAVTDPTADRTITLPDKSGTVLLTSTPGTIVLGTNTVTTTLQISHGLTTPQTAFCTLLNDSEANGATCTMTISGSTVTLKLWKADGATAGSVGKLVSWMVGGQP